MKAAKRDDEASFSIQAILICDQVRFENNGKAFLIGVYNDTIELSRIPATLPLTFAIRTRIDSPGDFELSLSVIDPARNNLTEGLRVNGRSDGEPGSLAWMPIGVMLQVGLEGEYQVKVDLAGAAAKHETFRVRRANQPPVIVSQSSPN